MKTYCQTTKGIDWMDEEESVQGESDDQGSDPPDIASHRTYGFKTRSFRQSIRNSQSRHSNTVSSRNSHKGSQHQTKEALTMVDERDLPKGFEKLLVK